MPIEDEPVAGITAVPKDGDKRGLRHFGDGIAGDIVSARIQGYSAADLGYRTVAVNSDGELVVNLEAATLTIGKVDQGTGGASAWKVDGSAVTQPVSGPLTDAQLRAVAVPVSLASVAVTQATAASLNAQVVGSVASAAADSGNPVKVGGVYKATQPTLLDNQRSDLLVGARGNLITSLAYGTEFAQINAGALFVGGELASGGVDTGNPVKVGARYNITQQTFGDGQRGNLQIDSRGALKVVLQRQDSGSALGTITDADGIANAVPLINAAKLYQYNGTTWDRTRGDITNGLDVDVTRLPSLVAGSATIGAINQNTGQGKTLLFGTITQGAAGTTQLVAADAAKKVKLVAYVILLDAAGSVKFTDGTVDLSGVMPIAVNGGVASPGQPAAHLLETAAINRPLNIVTVTGKAFGHFSYFLEA